MVLLQNMERIPIWVLYIPIVFLLQTANSTDDEVKQSLLIFFQRVSNGIQPTDPNFGWNVSSDPCANGWHGIECDSQSLVQKLRLDGLGLNGTLDANAICAVQTLSVLSIQNNSIHGEVSEHIANCKQLTHLFINNNNFSGSVPESVSDLSNLKRLSVSYNNFSGELPDFSKISGLIFFLAQSNHFTGRIPDFNFAILLHFNISFNQFSGPVPDPASHFDVNSFSGSVDLCGEPLPNSCPQEKHSKIHSAQRVLMFSGYIILGIFFVLFAFFIITKCKKTNGTGISEGRKKGAAVTNINQSDVPTDLKAETSKSVYSVPFSTETSMISSSLILPMNSVMEDLRFEDLLKAPAELLGRRRFSSTYKVIFEGRSDMAVKRIKDWGISSEEFRRRMEKINKVHHPNKLPALAYYSSMDEKLVVYEYQHNGSLSKLLNGTVNGQAFDWSTRLSVAAGVAECLAFMHKELYKDGIGHGNLKSSNVLMDKNMDPCISEYGLMVIDNEPLPPAGPGNGSKPIINHGSGHPDYPFKVDVYNFGVILLEQLTGILVEDNGSELARWVHSVVKEEWTAEVFDRVLFAEGASEERMVNLLQVALKCINPSPEARPSINQVAKMIRAIKENDDRSIVSEVYDE